MWKIAPEPGAVFSGPRTDGSLVGILTRNQAGCLRTHLLPVDRRIVLLAIPWLWQHIMSKSVRCVVLGLGEKIIPARDERQDCVQLVQIAARCH